jgi:hypothetical protein
MVEAELFLLNPWKILLYFYSHIVFLISIWNYRIIGRSLWPLSFFWNFHFKMWVCRRWQYGRLNHFSKNFCHLSLVIFRLLYSFIVSHFLSNHTVILLLPSLFPVFLLLPSLFPVFLILPSLFPVFLLLFP